MYPFEKLEIWQLSLELVEKIYKITSIPFAEALPLFSTLNEVVTLSPSLNNLGQLNTPLIDKFILVSFS